MNADVLCHHIREQLPALDAERQEELAQVVERLVTALVPEQIYVFGSQARGDAKASSDVDLLVIVGDSEILPHRRDQAAYRAIGWHSFPVDVMVMTRAEFERRRVVAASLAAQVHREGRSLYAA